MLVSHPHCAIELDSVDEPVTSVPPSGVAAADILPPPIPSTSIQYKCYNTCGSADAH